MQDQFSLAERVREFKTACAFRLMSGLPLIASIVLVKKSGKEIPEKELNSSIDKSAKVAKASSVLTKDNKFDLIIPATFRWSDMIGEGYISRISSIIGSAATVFSVPVEVQVDVWSVPNDKEVHKFVRLRSSETNPILLRRTEILAPLSPEEIEALPPRHAARTNKDLPVQRTVYKKYELDLSGPNQFLMTVKEIFDKNLGKVIQIVEEKPVPKENS